MDVETASAIEGVTDRIDTLGAAVREDIARLDTRVDALKTAVREDIARLDTRVDALKTALREDIARLDTRVDKLDARIEKLDNRVETLEGKVDLLEVSLRAEIVETRRHAVRLNEGTRDDIRLVAEAVAVLTVKVDALAR